MSESSVENGTLAAGGLAALLASACCLGPLALVSLGFGGAWIGSLTRLEPYRPLSLGVALVAMFFAYRRIYRPAAECKPGEICSLPGTARTYKVVFWTVSAMTLTAFVFPYVLPFFY